MSICVMIKYWNEEQLIPLNLMQWQHCNVNELHLYDGGSTDNSVELMKELTKDFPYKVVHYSLESQHDDYLKDCQKVEYMQLNQMNENAMKFDWVIHNDIDEIFNNNLNSIVNTINNFHFTALMNKRYNLTHDIYTYLYKMVNNNYAFHQDMQMRVYKPKFYYYPHFEDADTFPHSTTPINSIATANLNIFHLHDLIPNRRSIRGDSPNNINKGRYNDFHNPNNVYAKIDIGEIPQFLINWYNNININEIL